MQRFFLSLKEKMSSRTTFLNEFRDEVIENVNEESSFGEKFQNTILRHILKLKNELLIEMCRNYFDKNKADFYSFTIDKKMQSIDNAIQKGIKV